MIVSGRGGKPYARKGFPTEDAAFQDLMKEFSNRQHNDFAGNAYNLCSLAAQVLSTFLSMIRMPGKRKEQETPEGVMAKALQLMSEVD